MNFKKISILFLYEFNNKVLYFYMNFKELVFYLKFYSYFVNKYKYTLGFENILDTKK